MSARWAVLAIALAAAACTSPEATRVRAGGPGADIGNRGGVVMMHEGSQPFWETPLSARVRGPSLEPASQADRLSRGR